MLLEFGDDFCTACEPFAGVWHEGNYSIRCCSIAGVDVVDVHSISCIERTAANSNIVRIWKNVCSTHSEWSMMSARRRYERQGKKGERSDARIDPITPRGECVHFHLHTSTCLGISASNFLVPQQHALFDMWALLPSTLALYGLTEFQPRERSPLRFFSFALPRRVRAAVTRSQKSLVNEAVVVGSSGVHPSGVTILQTS